MLHFVGDYTRLTMEIQLVRSSGYYMIDSYIPTMFLVLASFVSCLVSLKHPEIKIGIPIACFLAMLFLMRSINEKLPKISYYKAIDIHSLLCTIQILFVSVGNYLMIICNALDLISCEDNLGIMKDNKLNIFFRQCIDGSLWKCSEQ